MSTVDCNLAGTPCLSEIKSEIPADIADTKDPLARVSPKRNLRVTPFLA